MGSLAVTVLGHDRPGIIADVTGTLALLGGNLEDSSMTLLRGHFAMTLIVNGVDADEVFSHMDFLREEGLVVSVLPTPSTGTMQGPRDLYTLSVHGADRPGIVSAMTAVVALHGGNIIDLTTRLGSTMYVLIADVEVPAGADVTAMMQQLRDTASDIGVDVRLQPAEPDLI